MAQVVGWAIGTGAVVLWLVALGVAVWQILRGRALAGAAIGLAAIGGLALRLLPTVMGLVMPTLIGVAGVGVAIGLERLVYGLGDAALVLLLLLGVALQRPAREASGG